MSRVHGGREYDVRPVHSKWAIYTRTVTLAGKAPWQRLCSATVYKTRERGEAELDGYLKVLGGLR